MGVEPIMGAAGPPSDEWSRRKVTMGNEESEQLQSDEEDFKLCKPLLGDEEGRSQEAKAP